MKFKIISSCFILFLFSLCSCGHDTEKQLTGEWKAHLLTERLDTLDLPPNDVRLTFSPPHMYTFEGTLRYREAGTFRVKGRVIFVKDTLNQKAEKAIHIESLKGDTLILNMMENKIPRRLEMHRVNKENQPAK